MRRRKIFAKWNYWLSRNFVAWIKEIIQRWLIKKNWPSHVRMPYHLALINYI